MLRQVDLDDIEVGLKIVALKTSSDSVYMVFDNQTFAAFAPRRAYEQEFLHNIRVTLDPSDGFGGYDAETCVELGIITQQEYDEAVRTQEEIESKRRLIYWKKEHERLGKLIAEAEASTKEDKESVTFGYCALCRAKEIELFAFDISLEQHEQACEVAGCKHPAFYRKV